MLFRHSMSIAQQLMPIYNTTVHKNKLNVALNLMWLTVVCLWKYQQATRTKTSQFDQINILLIKQTLKNIEIKE